MRGPFPRTRLGLFRGAWILAEITLLVPTTGRTGALHGVTRLTRHTG